MERRAMEVFDALCDLPHATRAAALEAACGDDAALRAMVTRMLAVDEREGGTWEAGDGAAILAAGLADDDAVPERVGDYRVVGVLGRGGMGVVYEAEQADPKRRVALKVVRTDGATRDAVRRFRHEAQMLGRLQHPGIAQILEAGHAEIGGAGRPFFAMEYVEGRPLHEHATHAGLSVGQRLELVARVADAVQHAHQKGVIHRDLKPANILVVDLPDDPIGQPKVLDFGVARLSGPPDADVSMRTQPGAIIGTLAYMSPEQLAGRAEDVDSRVDVYALGALLFELLAGRPPHDVTNRTLPDIARLVTERDAARLGPLVPEARGDIETIVATALDRDLDRRYGSASDLAAELRRFLRHEPIAARPATTLYQLRTFARRHRALVVASATAVVALVAGLAVATGGLLSAQAEARAKQVALDDAETERAISDAVTVFFSDLFASASPDERGRDVTVREVMDTAVASIGDRFTERPRVEAGIRQVIGATYTSLGEYEAAERELRLALSLREARLAPSDIPWLDTKLDLAWAVYYRGGLDAALETFDEVLARIAAHGSASAEHASLRVQALGGRAFMLMRSGAFEEAGATFDAAIAAHEQLPAADAAQGIMLRANLALLRSYESNDEVAEALYREVIDDSRAVNGPRHPRTGQYMANLASLWMRSGRLDEGLPMLEEALSIQEASLGPEHAKTLVTLNNLAEGLMRDGRYDAAEALCRSGMTRSRAAYGPDDRTALYLEFLLAKIEQESGRLDAAEARLVDTLERHRRILGQSALEPYHVYERLILFRLEHRDPATALAASASMLDDLEALGRDHDYRWMGQVLEMMSLLAMGRFDDAETRMRAFQEIAPVRRMPSIEGRLEQIETARREAAAASGAD